MPSSKGTREKMKSNTNHIKEERKLSPNFLRNVASCYKMHYQQIPCPITRKLPGCKMDLAFSTFCLGKRTRIVFDQGTTSHILTLLINLNECSNAVISVKLHHRAMPLKLENALFYKLLLINYYYHKIAQISNKAE